jgi:hypothetical protein
MQQQWPIIFFALYFIAFMVASTGLGYYFTKRQRTKPPLDFKFLRGPGESLRQRMAKFDEDLILILGGAALAPVFAGLLTLGFILWTAPHMRSDYALGITAAVFLPVLVLSMRWFLQKMFRNRNDRLGYLGERAVGEALTPLHASNYAIFHDVPAEGGGHTFNVDHVVVGANGVFAIETKTRRKGKARPGFEAHKVAYDGQRLIWPWGEDTNGLENAETRARWLSEWINKMTGVGIAAKPILVLPGWYVVSQALGPVTVVNHKQLCRAIDRASANILTREQIDLIARQLDERCRDVED